MKRLSTGFLAVLCAAGFGATALATNGHGAGNTGDRTVAQTSGSSMPTANFGSPPSGTIPILFNDHHVYAKPDTLKQGRVLAALVRGGTVLIPLRSMFEQMGATVSYDPASKTVDVSKPGADVKVTVGQPTVTINGESRPLDVPPIMVKGQVLVPIRVISEGMGAYVEWVPDRQIVVVRYLPPTPPPTPAPTEAPTAAPTEVPTAPPTPTPAPKATPYHDLFIAGDYLFSPKVYNEFSPGNTGKNGSYAVRGAIEFNTGNLPWMLEGDFRDIQYPHNCASAADPQCLVTSIGTGTQTVVPAFSVRDMDFDGRFGLKVADPRIYVGVGYLARSNNYGYPQTKGIGYGAEKLPDLDQPWSVYGSVWYYPNNKATCDVTVCPSGPFTLSYNILKYQIGGTYRFGTSPVFLDLGFLGSSLQNKTNAPSNVTNSGPYLGLGIRF